LGIAFGKNARCSFLRGDLVCSMQYVNGEEAACFYPAPHARRKGAAAYVICLSAGWKYANEKYLVQQARVAAEKMHMDQNKSTVKKLADFMSDMLIELYSMKPMPDSIDEVARKAMGRVERVDLGANSAKIVVG
jgi:hypothetical protein